MLHHHLTVDRTALATLWRKLLLFKRGEDHGGQKQGPQTAALAATEGWPVMPANLPLLARLPMNELPPLVQTSPTARYYLQLLGELDWAHFPERPDHHLWPGLPPQRRAPYVAAFLVKLDQQLRYMSDLHSFLSDHVALAWLLGFELTALSGNGSTPGALGAGIAACLPSQRQFSRVLRTLPNPALQFLLDSAVGLIQATLPPELHFGDQIAMDTKHILAWVKENNPNRYAPDRFDKTKQPKGDPDCKLGCKQRTNQRTNQRSTQGSHPAAGADAAIQPGAAAKSPAAAAVSPAAPLAAAMAAAMATGTAAGAAIGTPTTNPQSTEGLEIGVFYWGYASGIVTTKLPDIGEFVLAEYTQPFNAGDATYFFPLMQAVERRLGFRPRFGALDAAFDAFYVYDYFDVADGFAAVPRAERGKTDRHYDVSGAPLCDAGLPMVLKHRFTDRTHHIPHQKARYHCPLLHPLDLGQPCPIQHPKWSAGGCLTTVVDTSGAKIRCELDRKSDAFVQLYAQRTTTERIFSQAKELGIERPMLRNQASIANLNTLTYLLLNLRAYQRCRLLHK